MSMNWPKNGSSLRTKPRQKHQLQLKPTLSQRRIRCLLLLIPELLHRSDRIQPTSTTWTLLSTSHQKHLSEMKLTMLYPSLCLLEMRPQLHEESASWEIVEHRHLQVALKDQSLHEIMLDLGFLMAVPAVQ